MTLFFFNIYLEKNPISFIMSSLNKKDDKIKNWDGKI